MSPFVAACAHVGSFAVQHHTWEQEYDPCAAPCEMQVLASGAGHVHVQGMARDHVMTSLLTDCTDVCHVTMTSSRSLNCALVWVEWDVTAADTDRTAAPSSDSSQQVCLYLKRDRKSDRGESKQKQERGAWPFFFFLRAAAVCAPCRACSSFCG